jgi:CSLREA domain-containing protein/uncharacterized repeat protein (TIGR01451 family)
MKARIPLLSFVLLFIATLVTPIATAQAAGTTRYVRTGGSTSGTCTTWATACTLQQALNVAADGDEVWVAAGIYLPASGPQSNTISISKALKLYGGFPPSGTPVIGDRNYVAYPTVLSGDQGHNDAEGTVSDNNYCVVQVNASVMITGVVTMDGFTVTGGYGPYPTCAGMIVSSNVPGIELTHMTFRGNHNTGAGSGIYFYEVPGPSKVTHSTFIGNSSNNGAVAIRQSEVKFEDVLFQENDAAAYGGAVYAFGLGVAEDPLHPVTFNNVRFIQNTAGNTGGGIWMSSGAATLDNVLFAGNTAGGNGPSGISCSQVSPMTITNGLFSGNKSSKDTIYSGGCGMTLTNVTIAGNTGEALAAYGETTITLRNSIVSGNSGGLGRGVNIQYSDIQNGCEYGSSCDIHTIYSDPRFVAPVDPASAPTTAGDYHLRPQSPAIDAGDNTVTDPILPSADLGGTVRLYDAPDTTDTGNGTAPIVDMGAYEYNGAVPNLRVSQADNVSATVALGNSFTWTLTAHNTGSAAASFPSGSEILRDSLPVSGATYGTPSVQNASGLTGTVTCTINTSVLSCTANGAVSLAGSGGAFDVVVPVTPNAVGTLTNASCSVDPGDVIGESQETDNTCSSDMVTVARAIPTLTYQIHNSTHTVITTAPDGLQIHGWGQVSAPTGFATPTGQISLGVYDNADCSGTAQGTFTTSLSGGTAESTSIAAQSFYYKVTYAGDSVYQSVASGCELFETYAATQQPGPTFTVNTILDDTLDNMCSDGHCTLREAINAANADTSTTGKTILFAVGDNQTLTLASALPAITVTQALGGLVINGNTHTLTVDGDHKFRVFQVNPGAKFKLDYLTVAHGHSGTNGGGLYSNAAEVELDHCAFVGNSAGGHGGAVYVYGDGHFDIGNLIYLAATNCTFSDNTAGSGGGGLVSENEGRIELGNDTISGGGVANLDATGYVETFTTIIDRGGSTDTCSGNFHGSYNLASSVSSCSSSVFTLSPSIRLAPLANYGGDTPTLALLPGSAAIDAGSPYSCRGSDQRGLTRSQGYNYICDIGAFESYGFTLSSPTGAPQSATIGTAFAAPLGLTVTAKRAGEPVAGGVVTFTPPATGASAAITSSPATIASDGTVSVTARANSIAGGPYSVAASTVYAATDATFSLTNTAPTVELSNLTQTYDGTSKTVGVTTNPSGLTVDVTYDGISTPPVNAGSYAVVATINQSPYSGSASGTLVVSPREITLTAVTDSKVYDRTVTSSAVPTITLGSLASGDSASWSQTFDNRNAGSGKTLTPTGSVSDGNSGNNYNVTFVPVTTGQISARSITVTAVTDSKVYDGTTASSGAPTITNGSLADGDSAAWSQTFDTANVDVDKTLTPTGSVSDGNNGNNYAVTFNDAGGGQIIARPISVAADAQTKVYGDADPVLTYRVTEGTFIGQDTLSGALARVGGNDVGSYAIQQGKLTAGDNYELSFTGADLTITPRDLTVRAGDATILVGEALPTFIVTYDSFVSGDDADDLGGTLSFDTSATSASPVGDYPVTPKGLTSHNYAIHFASGTLHITTGALDLSLAMTASRLSLLSGLDLTYTLTAANPGPGSALAVQIHDPLPAGTSLVSASSGCSASGGMVTCDLGSLAAGASAEVTITVNVGVSVSGTLANTASLSASQADPDPANNTASVTVQVARSKTIYANNFEEGIGEGWCSEVSTSATPSGVRHFLGEFGNQDVCLSLEGIEEHKVVMVSFDLYLIRSWDGNDTVVGPDEWLLKAGTGEGDPAELLHTTFSNWLNGTQSYPDAFSGGNHPAWSGASEINTLGYQYAGVAKDSVYHVTLTMDHQAAKLLLGFLAQGLQKLADESWGLDNVTVVITGGAELTPNRLYLPAVTR